SLACESSLTGLVRQENGVFRLSFTGTPQAADGPVGVVTDADGLHTLAPAGLPQTVLDRFAQEPLTGGAVPEKATAVLVLRERETGAEYRLATESEVRRTVEGGLTVAGTAELDPTSAAGGDALDDGAWDLYVRLTALGWTKTARLGRTRTAEVSEELTGAPHPADPARTITPYWTRPHRDLSLRVETPEPAPAPRKQGLLRRVAKAIKGK
ncbi:hypothetical protein ACWD3D_35445, partial [Streptomyces sp. NPDC002690]